MTQLIVNHSLDLGMVLYTYCEPLLANTPSSWLMSNLDACFIKIPNVIYIIIVLDVQSC
jgi:hypothetical protein